MRLGADRSEQIEEALRSCRHHLIGVIVFSALLNALLIAPTLYMLQVYDRVVPSRGGLTLLYLTLVLLFALATLSALDALRGRLLIRASIRLDRQLAGKILDRVLDPRARQSSQPLHEAMRDFDQLRQTLTGPAILAVADAPWMPIYVIICALIHPLLGLLVLVGAVLLGVLAIHNERGLRGLLGRANEVAAVGYAGQDQLINSSDIVLALGMRRNLVARQLRGRETVVVHQIRASFRGGTNAALSRFLRLTLQSLGLGLGAWLAIDGKISGGAIFATSFLSARALQPLDQLVATWPSIIRAREAYARLTALLSGPASQPEPTKLPRPSGRLEVAGLAVKHPAGEQLILSNVSFSAQPGEIIALIGPSGAGKSTLLRALAGALDRTAGTIRFDGSSIDNFDRDRLGRSMGYLPQEATLLAGSIKENISRFDSGADVDECAIAAARAASAHDMIIRLPQGYDTPLGSRGRGLSAGQAQRIGLARALYRDPSVILLDEPNAHLDSESEKQFTNDLHSLKRRGALVVIAAHRLAVLSATDKILVLRDGKLQAFGARDDILQRLGAPVESPPVLRSSVG